MVDYHFRLSTSEILMMQISPTRKGKFDRQISKYVIKHIHKFCFSLTSLLNLQSRYSGNARFVEC